MTTAIQNIMSRTSVRIFTDAKVPDEAIETILKAAMAAPSAMNKQPWHFFVVSDEKVRNSVAGSLEYGKQSLRLAPVAIIVAGDSSRFFEEAQARDYWVEDCSAAAENILLAAHALGLGAVWCGVYPIEERVVALRKAVGADDSIIPLCIIAIGYPAGEHQAKDKWDPAKVTYLLPENHHK